MIKLFRRLRQSFIDVNVFSTSGSRASNYLLYAIGEIILVVIGILLALQINEWNNKRKKNQLEKVLLQEVRVEIDRVYQDALSDIRLLRFGQRSHGRILSYIRNDAAYADSMCLDFYWLIRDEYVYPKEAVYSKIKQEGIDIISNDSLRSSIQLLYESHFPRLTVGHTFYPNLELIFWPYYQDHFKPDLDVEKMDTIDHPRGRVSVPRKIPDMDGNIILNNLCYIPRDFEHLKKDDRFLMLLDQSFRGRNFKIYRYKTAIEEIENIYDLIDKELQNH